MLGRTGCPLLSPCKPPPQPHEQQRYAKANQEWNRIEDSPLHAHPPVESEKSATAVRHATGATRDPRLLADNPSRVAGVCSSENSGFERQITLRQGRHDVRDRGWHWCLMTWRSIALKASLQSSFADSAILSALQNSARDPLRTFTRASTANPHASAGAPYASSRSSASRHFMLRLSVPRSYPS